MDIDYFIVNGRVNSQRLKEKHIINQYPSFHKDVITFCNDNLSQLDFHKKVWYYLHKEKELLICPQCNKNERIWKSFRIGYKKYCSNECSYSSKDRVKKAKITNLNKYGCENPMQNEIVKNKTKITNLERYGEISPLSNKEIREKAKLTNLRKYGVDNVFKSVEIKNKIKNTNLIKYGTYNYINSKDFIYKKKIYLKSISVNNSVFESKTIQNQIKNTNLIKYGVDNYFKYYKHKEYMHKYNLNNIKSNLINLGINKNNILKIVSNDEITLKCNNCNNNYTTYYYHFYQRIKKYNADPCTICNNTDNISNKELELLNYIKDNYTGTIIENNRSVLNGKELDVYLPELKLAFEFNGNYWHSTKYKNKDYHLNKTNQCLDLDIQLMHIYEDDWDNKNHIIKSYILKSLKASTNIKNNLIIKNTKYLESKKFYTNNSLKIFPCSNIKLGVFENNMLISLMIIKKTKTKYIILDHCDLLNCNMKNTFEKLFEYFIGKYSPNKVLLYVDKGYINFEKYENIGFKYIKDIKPNMIIKNNYELYNSGYKKYKYNI